MTMRPASRWALPILLLLSSLAPLSCEARYEERLSAAEGVPILRIRLGDDVTELSVQVRGPWEIRMPVGGAANSQGSVLARGTMMKPTRVRADNGRVTIGTSVFPDDRVVLWESE
ncbi:MAG: hypothetical protein QGD94_08555, partial [Planctomycetia bacterium]|nr:hypothetical protein [Planctomycetia bacterium]